MILECTPSRNCSIDFSISNNFIALLVIIGADLKMNSFKVISKTSVESKTFDLKVGPQKGSGAGIVITRGKLPQHVEKEDADFRGKLKKVQKKVTLTKDNEGVKGDIWTMLRDANPREYDKIAFQNGVKDHRAMLKRLTNVKKLNKRGGKSFVIRLPDTQEGITLIIYLGIPL